MSGRVRPGPAEMSVHRHMSALARLLAPPDARHHASRVLRAHLARRTQQQFRCFAAAAAATPQPATPAAQAGEQQPPQPPPQQAQQPRAAGQHPQTVDFTTLAACAAELRQRWCPSRVEQALQVSADTVALRLRTLDASAWLYLCWHPTMGHIGVGGPPERGSSAEGFSFGEQLQAGLRGRVLSDIGLPAAWERVVRLDLAERPAEAPSHALYCEVMGRYSNVVLAEGPAGTVLAAGYQVGGKMSSLRQVQVGGAYFPPPPAPGIDPDSLASLEEWRDTLLQAAELVAAGRGGAGGATFCTAAVRAFRGVSPSLARELCTSAGVAPGAAPTELGAAEWDALHGRWQQWLARVASGSFAASSCESSGAYSVLGGYPREEGSLLGLMHSVYASQRGEDAFAQARQRLSKTLTSSMQRLERKIESLQRQGGRSELHLETAKQGDLLMANLHRCVPGQEAVEVEDWDSPGTMLTLALDPRKTAVQAAEALYRSARKQRRAVEQVAPLVAEARASLAYLGEVELMLGQLEGPPDMAALREVQAELVAGGYMKAPPDAALAEKAATKARRAQKRGRDGAAGGSGSGAGDFRRYTSPGGLAVLVGRNSRQNDELTMRMAQPNDVWMHARGVPGAHVLLRVPKGQTPADADVQYAADLSAWFSKARSEGKAEVTCACPSDISKPRGAKPGQVLVKRERTVLARPHESEAAKKGEAD